MTKLLAELDTYCETGEWRQALELLDRVDKDKSLPTLDPFMYERAIATCARMGKVEVLPGLLNNMVVDDLTPTSATIDFIVQSYLAKEHWGLIVQLATETAVLGVALSPAAFHAIMEACGQTKDADSAYRIVKQLRAAQVKLSVDDYAAAIRAAGMGRQPDLATALFVQMEEQDGLPDNGQAFTQLIRAQVLNGHLEQALQSFATASQRGLSLDERIYTNTIDALVSNKKHWQATRLFEQMLEGGEKHPSVFCLGRAMVAYTGANRSQHAWACWHKILELKEATPSPLKYNKLVQGLSQAKDAQLVVSVFDQMQKLFEPGQIHQGAYATAIRFHGRLGETQKAVDLFDEFMETCTKTGRGSRYSGIYLALFNALSRDTVRDPALNTRDAKRAWRLMAANVPVVLPPAYASLAGVFASTGEMETLAELISHAEQSWSGSADVMHSEHEEEDDGPEMATLAVFDGDDPDVGSENDVLLFNGVISGLSKARDDQTANIEAYLDTMLSRGLSITDSIVRATTDACLRFENWRLMRNLLEILDMDALLNAEVCTGDTVSKLLEAGEWRLGREWLLHCHRRGLRPTVRRKIKLLHEMRESESKEWQIAYALATETLAFRRVGQEQIDSVADAAEVCRNADRLDLVVKLFDTAAGHSSLRFFANHSCQVEAGRTAHQPLQGSIDPVVVPLSLYKNATLASLQQSKVRGSGFDRDVWLQKAEHICRRMLETHGKDLDGEALSMAISIKATAGDHDDVGALYRSMRALGLEPNSYAQNAAIVAFSRQRRIDDVLLIRDDLLASRDEAGQVKSVEANVAKSLLFSLALAHETEALQHAVQHLPGCTMDMALEVLGHLHRYTEAVEFFDARASIDVFDSLFSRLCHSGHPVLAATLVLKHARLNGLHQIHPNRVIRVTNALIEQEHVKEAEKLLQLYVDNTNGLSLKQTPPYFQQHAMEMLLFLYGESGHFEAMQTLFDKEVLGFPLSVAHYEVAMEYCAASRDELAGAVASLKLFEKLRTRGFIRPSGNTYLLTLQSCLRLERLEPVNSSAVQSTGQIILNDVRENGFQKLVTTALAKQVARAMDQVHAKNQKVFRRVQKQDDAVDSNVISPEELARIALFCHRHGLPLTTKLATNLLRLHKHLPAMIVNELTFVKRSLDEGLGVVTVPRLQTTSTVSKRVGKPKTSGKKRQATRVPALFAPASRHPRRRSKSYDAAVRAATDARWGVVLEPIVAETE